MFDQLEAADVDPSELIDRCGIADEAQRQALKALFRNQADKADRANESFLQFLSCMSHDLRGGLNGVLLMVEVIRRELSSRPEMAGIMDDLDMMRNSLLGTVANLERYLYAERFRRGKVATRLSTVDMCDVLNEQAKRLAYDATDRRVTLTINAASPCKLNTDRTLVGLIVGNLIENAIKFSNPGGEVRVMLETSPQGNECRIVVKDQGKGIPPQKLIELLTPTPDQDAVATGKTGLGFHNARHAAKLLGAKLTGDSTEGEGSTFRIEFSGKLFE